MGSKEVALAELFQTDPSTLQLFHGNTSATGTRLAGGGAKFRTQLTEMPAELARRGFRLMNKMGEGPVVVFSTGPSKEGAQPHANGVSPSHSSRPRVAKARLVALKRFIAECKDPNSSLRRLWIPAILVMLLLYIVLCATQGAKRYPVRTMDDWSNPLHIFLIAPPANTTTSGAFV